MTSKPVRHTLTKRYCTLAVAVTKAEKEQAETLARSLGYKSVSSWLHDLIKAQLS